MKFYFLALLYALTLANQSAQASDPHQALKKAKEDHGKASSTPEKTPSKEESKGSTRSKNFNDFLKHSTCESMPQKTIEHLWKQAECYYNSKTYQQAVDVLRIMSRRDPKNIDAHVLASWILWKDGELSGGALSQKRNTEALEELNKARAANPSHWEVDVEIGDFHYLRLHKPENGYQEYLRARNHYDGDPTRGVMAATPGRKGSIETRIAMAAKDLGRKGEAIEAACRALFFDPDDIAAQDIIKKLYGSCVKKEVKDPRNAK